MAVLIYMTTTQGGIILTTTRITKIIDRVACKEMNKLVNNEEFTNAITKQVLDNFSNELLDITLKKYMEVINPTIYAKKNTK